MIFIISSTVGIGTAYAYGSDGGYLTTSPPLYPNTMNLIMHTNLTSPALQAPPPYVPPSITVNTNLENYSTGDKITISGHISSPNDKIPLVIKIFNPNHEMSFNKLFPPSLNQSYAWTVSTVAFWDFVNSGNYTVLIQYGQDYATTHFYLNSTLTQYLYSQSPLWQYNEGMSAQDVHCHAGLTLVVRAEDFTPACVQPLTATKLILRGWALGTAPINPFISKIDLIGLQQNYTVGQKINATVIYAGYWINSDEPDTKIFNANGTQIWFNCPNCVMSTSMTSSAIPSLSYGTFTYHVQNPNGNPPIINETGTYTMIASLDNKTASAKFDVIPVPSIQQNNTGIVNIGNQTNQMTEFDGVIVDQSLDARHFYSLYTNDTSEKFNIGSNGIWLDGLNNIDGLDGKYVRIFGTLVQVPHSEDEIRVDKFQTIDSLVPKANPTRNTSQQITLEELYSNPDKYYNQTVTITGQLREYDNPIAYAGVGCSSAQFTTSDIFVPDFVSRHQLYNGQNYIGVRIGGADDLGYSPTERLPADLKNKSVSVTGIFVPEIHDTGMCMHILHKSGYLLTDFSKIVSIRG